MRFLLVLLISLSVLGCRNRFTQTDSEIYLVKWNERQFGFMDSRGNEVIAPQYSFAMPFSEGLAGVNIGGNFRKRKMPTDGKWGFINLKGEFIINPKFYSPPVFGGFYNPDSFAYAAHQAYLFSEGLAAVCVESNNSRSSEWAYINKKGEIKIRKAEIRSARAFNEGLANVYIKTKDMRRGLWGYINSYGEMVIEPRFLFPANFRQGFALVVNQKGEKILIDKKGFRYLPQYQILTHFINGYGTVRPKWIGEASNIGDNRKTLLVNIHGAPMTESEFDWVGMYGSGLAPALVGSKIGNPVVYPQTLSTTAEAGGKWGYINLKGHFIINPQYENARGFREGFAAVKSGGLWGYIRENGSMITEHEFRWAGFFENGISPVRLGPIHGDYDGRFAYIDNDGDVIWIEPEHL
ncbi:MAG: WG repeat-containing protein [Bacteroidia bacterium]|nr:WG repeat-containing protein [Bacteroidia bacterium]